MVLIRAFSLIDLPRKWLYDYVVLNKYAYVYAYAHTLTIVLPITTISQKQMQEAVVRPLNNVSHTFKNSYIKKIVKTQVGMLFHI